MEMEKQMTETNRKIAFICSKGNLDMAYPALIMGQASSLDDRYRHLFHEVKDGGAQSPAPSRIP